MREALGSECRPPMFAICSWAKNSFFSGLNPLSSSHRLGYLAQTFSEGMPRIVPWSFRARGLRHHVIQRIPQPSGLSDLPIWSAYVNDWRLPERNHLGLHSNIPVRTRLEHSSQLVGLFQYHRRSFPVC